MAIEKRTGKVLWTNDLKGMGYNPLTLTPYTYTQHGSYTTELLFVGVGGKKRIRGRGR